MRVLGTAADRARATCTCTICGGADEHEHPIGLGLGLGLGLLLFAAGCGLEGAGDPAVPSGAAGNAPWTDLGPVRVCLDATAIGPATSATAGQCVPGDAVAATCSADSECRDREACVCGACVVPYCDTTADCAAPFSCDFALHRCAMTCTESLDCGDAENCLNGVCLGRCATSADCQHGEFCDFQHVCSSDDCASAADCQGTERCELQRVPHQLVEPSPVGHALYVEVDGQVWRAVCDDPTHCRMDPDAPILDGRAPSVVVDGDRTFVYIERDDGIAVASSTDGINFPLPSLLIAGDYHTPGALHANGQAIVYYAQGDAIGLAVAGVDQLLDDQGIVLRPADVDVGTGDHGTAFWLGITRLASPQPLLVQGDIHLWFSARGVESADATKFGQDVPIPPNDSVGFAAAHLASPGDLSVWPYGPVVDRVDAFLEHRDDLGPGVVDAGDDVFFLYEVDGETSTGVLGHLQVLSSGR